MIRLEFPTMKRKQEALDFIQEFYDNDSEIHGTGGLDNRHTYEEWVQRVEDFHHGINVESVHVPATTYFCVDQNNSIIGMVNIRHKLNKFLIINGYGHIGYSVRPSERRKGYATEILKQALQYCKELGISTVHVGCYKDNIASKRTIEKNNGVLLREFENHGKLNLEYQIFI